MEYIGGFLKSGAGDIKPEEAISILSDRLQNSNLPSDRRTAVSGLKSFSRQYREIVVEYASKALFKALLTDSEDVLIVKAILECILILFLKAGDKGNGSETSIRMSSRVTDGKYASPLLLESFEVDQFSLWIADECTSSIEYMSCLIELLHNYHDYHVKSYTLQLLEAILIARPVRTRNLLTYIPSSVSTVVSVLKDEHDQIRGEAILLLIALVKDNNNIQKVVAFENTFDILLEIIGDEGGIRGSVIVEDCLTLLLNLLAYNASNQKYFLETGCTPKLVGLLNEPFDATLADHGSDGHDVAMLWNPQRVKNVMMLLDICLAFVDQDNQDLTKNQDVFFECGIFYCVAKIGFATDVDGKLRALALSAIGDLMANNQRVQLEFAKLDVPYVNLSLPVLCKSSKSLPAPDMLLLWALSLNSVNCFEIRLRSSYCFECFIKGNKDIKKGFMAKQVKMYSSHQSFDGADDEVRDNTQSQGKIADYKDRNPDPNNPNLLHILVHHDDEFKLNPYKPWFAAFFMLHLIEDCEEAKSLAQNLTVGDEKQGEDVMSFLQAVSQMLVSSLEFSDPRVPLAYISLLTCWLFEDYDAVNDFLCDMDTFRAILASLMKSSPDSKDLIDGAGYILIGITYEFSRSTSPCSRQSLHDLVVKSIGAENYSLKVKKFFQTYLAGYICEINSISWVKDDTGLPNVFLLPMYRELVQENYHRIKQALIQDPARDRPRRITYELFQELDAQYQDLRISHEDLIKTHTRTKEDFGSIVDGLRTENEQQKIELRILTEDFQKSSLQRAKLDDTMNAMTSQLEQFRKALDEKRKQISDLTSELESVGQKYKQALSENKKFSVKLKEATESRVSAENGINKMNRELKNLTTSYERLREENDSLRKSVNNNTKHTYEVPVSSHNVKLPESRSGNVNIIARTPDDSIENVREKLETLQVQLEAQTKEVITRDQNIKVLMEKLKSAAQIVLGLKEEIRIKDQDLINLKQNPSQSILYKELQTAVSLPDRSLGPKEKESNSEAEQRQIPKYGKQQKNLSNYGRIESVSHVSDNHICHKCSKITSDLSSRDRQSAHEGEFEDLMLLWEEQASKANHYKKILRELDFEVSSDEDALP